MRLVLAGAALASLLLSGCLSSDSNDDADAIENRRGHPPQVCPPGEAWTCYSAPLETDGIGACERGVKTCNAEGTGYGACVGEVTPRPEICDGVDNDCNGIVDEGCTPSCVPSAEVCGDGADNDCDGAVDEGCHCPPGEAWTCYEAPLDTDGIGACQRGVKTCNAEGSGYGACVGQVLPTPEVCGNGVDDDCDGATDEDCDPHFCSPGDTVGCYDGPAGTMGVGACAAGTETCNAAGSGYGACTGQVLPSAEVCGNGVDDDCDGQQDDDCVCAPGSAQACYDGPAGTAGVGQCAGGSQICDADGSGWGACTDQTLPVPEICGNEFDDSCDGRVDEGCVCAPGSAQACYDGPAGTAGVGTCTAGTQTCDADGSGLGGCVGSIGPSAEVCGDGLDNDCDGSSDEGCVCAPGATTACYDGPADTVGVGVCAAGTQTCDPTGTGYGACVGTVGPSAEVCGDGLDNDCDGEAEEDCLCAPDSIIACYQGPAGTAGVGVCATGTQVCSADGTGVTACLGAVLPGAEVCGNNLDDDCDGSSDEGCVCAPLEIQACYSGPAGTAGVGECRPGARTCNADGTGFSACTGAVTPVAEVCGDNRDNDCDGQVDEGCIGDRAWRDRNTNGIQDAGEVGVSGAIFLLRTAAGALIAVTTSDAAGTYYFSNIPTGSYYLEVIPPVGAGTTSLDAGGNDALDSDFDGETNATPVFFFDGSAAYQWDCGLVGGTAG